MPITEEEFLRAFDEARALDGPLQDRLALLSAKRQGYNPALDAAYERMVARIKDVGADAPGVGDEMPDFVLPDDRGRLLRLDDLLEDGPLVVSLNRGHWCSNCRLELQNFAAISPAISALGANIVSIMPEPRRYTTRLKAANHLDFPIFTDLDLAYVLSLGLMFWVGDDVKDILQGVGIDLSQFQGNDGWFLPIPATFVVGRDRIVAARFIDPDFRHRMTDEAIFAALETLG